MSLPGILGKGREITEKFRKKAESWEDKVQRKVAPSPKPPKEKSVPVIGLPPGTTINLPEGKKLITHKETVLKNK